MELISGRRRWFGTMATVLIIVLAFAGLTHFWRSGGTYQVIQARSEGVSDTTDLLPALAENDPAMARELFRYIENPSIWCRRLTMFGGTCNGGGRVDGDKFVCLDADHRPRPGSCLVYSFGIAHEWSFDVDMIRFGCKVHAFDPSMTQFPEGQTSFGAHFYRIGLGTKAKRINKSWSMKTLSEIMKLLGHEGRMIDYLKVDIEGSEWEWLETDSISLKNVRQIGMEIHMNKVNLRKYYKAFQRIHQLGFRIAHSSPNRVFGRPHSVKGVEEKVGLLYEIMWIKQQGDT